MRKLLLSFDGSDRFVEINIPDELSAVLAYPDIPESPHDVEAIGKFCAVTESRRAAFAQVMKDYMEPAVVVLFDSEAVLP